MDYVKANGVDIYDRREVKSGASSSSGSWIRTGIRSRSACRRARSNPLGAGSHRSRLRGDWPLRVKVEIFDGVAGQHRVLLVFRHADERLVDYLL